MLVYFVIQSLRRVSKTKAYLRIVYASTALLLAIYILSLSSDPEEYFCKDNAISYNMLHDGTCSLSACLSVCLSVCLSMCLPACAPVCLSVCLYACLRTCLLTCLYACLPARLPA